MFSGELWQVSFTVAYVFMAGVFAYRFYEKFDKFLGAFIFLLLMSGMRIFAASTSPFLGSSDQWIESLDRSSLSATFTLLLILSSLMTMRRSFWDKFFKAIFYINGLMIVGGYFIGKPWGILFNSSMSGCFEIALLPLVDSGIVAMIIAICSLFAGAQSIPFGCFTIYIFFRVFFNRDYIAAVAFGIFSALMALAYLGPHMLFSTNSRSEIWAVTFDYFQSLSPKVKAFGIGLGSFEAIGPNFLPDKKFIWLHSDWMQIVFETGYAGYFACVLFLGYTLNKKIFGLRQDSVSNMRLPILIYSGWMCANMPLHYPLAALYGAFLIRRIYN